MDKRAWVSQLKKQVDVRGADKASWYVNWTDPSGRLRCKSCGPGKVGKSAANKLADQIHSELVTGTYQGRERLTWEQFFARYSTHVENRYDARSRDTALRSLRTFERVAKPSRMASIDTAKIDEFIGLRLKETRGKDEGKRAISPATINRELRYVRAAMRLALDWGFVEKIPRFRFLKPQQKLPTFVSAEHFAAMFAACDVATMPGDLRNATPGDWWRGLLVTLYMTGWRIGQMLSLRWADVDLEAGTALSRADDNKGGRDELIPLHPLAVERLRPLAGSFSKMVFPWDQGLRKLWPEFQRIQEAATLADGKPLPRGGKNGSHFGFHDLRRGFATVNAASMNLFELQKLMQHKSLATTQGYVNMANQLNRAVQNLFVPTLPAKDRGLGTNMERSDLRLAE